MRPFKLKINFEYSGYFFIGLVLLALLGFWKSYFAPLFSGEGFSFYFHFHFTMVMTWMAMLIIQPLLIRFKRLKLHRQIGRLSYFIMPLIFISMLLLINHAHSIEEGDLSVLFIAFKDLILLSVAFYVAIRYRKTPAIHARGMIATGIIFIEPALVRTIDNYLLPLPAGYFLSILLLYGLLFLLIIRERKAHRGRWVFPLILGTYIIVHGIYISGIFDSILHKFGTWYVQLPLT